MHQVDTFEEIEIIFKLFDNLFEKVEFQWKEVKQIWVLFFNLCTATENLIYRVWNTEWGKFLCTLIIELEIYLINKSQWDIPNVFQCFRPGYVHNSQWDIGMWKSTRDYYITWTSILQRDTRCITSKPNILKWLSDIVM